MTPHQVRVMPAAPSYTTPLQRDMRARRVEAALAAIARAAMVLVLIGATLQAARLTLGTAALDAVLARAAAERGW